eukprot:SAG22_NODE_176_length_16162_cov_30.625910_8_plen_2203_part_00
MANMNFDLPAADDASMFGQYTDGFSGTENIFKGLHLGEMQDLQSYDMSAYTRPPPRDLKCAHVTDTIVCLKWSSPNPVSPSSGARLGSYNVYNGDGSRISMRKSATDFYDTGLTPGATYTYRITAVYQDGRESAATRDLVVQTPLQADTVDGALAFERDMHTAAAVDEGTAIFVQGGGGGGGGTTSGSSKPVAGIELDSLVREFSAGVELKDRRKMLTVHKSCFVGTEATKWLQTWLQGHGYVSSQKDALMLGNRLMDTGLFEEVNKDHIFKDKFLFYRFTNDGGATTDDECCTETDAELHIAAPSGADASGPSSDGIELDFNSDGMLFGGVESTFANDVDDALLHRRPAPNRHPAPVRQVHNDDQTLSSGIVIKLDLRTKQWQHVGDSRTVPWNEQPRMLIEETVQSLAVAGRHSRAEKDSDRRAEEILRTPNWSISADTPLEDIEHLIALLCKGLEKWTDTNATTMSWCVGGSLQATLDHRAANHSSHVLRFVLCNKADWTGDRRSKVGNTCKFHCGGLQVSNVVVRGKRIDHINLKKCTWLKCCYGKKWYGDPPSIPWCEQCEYQKKLSKRKAPAKDVAGKSGNKMSAGRFAVSDVTPCNSCVKEIARLKKMGAESGAVRICDACTKLLGKVDGFVHKLVVTNYAMSDDEVASFGGNGGSDRRSPGGKRMRKELPQQFRAQLKDIMVVTFGEIDLKQQAEQQLDPILLDAMLVKYQADDIEDLWQTNEEARSALMRMVLKNISIGYHLYHAVQQLGSEVMDAAQAELVRKISMPEFLTGWNAVLVRDGCVMVAYSCPAGFAELGVDIIKRNTAYFAKELGVVCAAPVVKDRMVGFVCTSLKGSDTVEEPTRRTFGTAPVSLDGSPATFLEFIEYDYEAAAMQWLQADPGLALYKTPDGKTPLHIACALNRQTIALHLIQQPNFGYSIGNLLGYVMATDLSGMTAIDMCAHNARLSELIAKRVAEVSIIAIQSLGRGFLARIGFESYEQEKSAELFAIRQSHEEDKQSTAERVKYLTKLAAACRDNDAEGVHIYTSRLSDFSIETLDLDDNGIFVLPPAVVSESMVSLEMLSLMNNYLTALPNGIKCLPFLKHLYLDDNHFEVLPSVICEIDSLEVLSAKNNQLASLPIGLVNLGQLRQLQVDGNPFVTPSSSVTQKPWPEIRKYLLQRVEHKVAVDTMKVMLIGSEGAGKTTLKSSMKNIGGATGLIQGLWNRSPPGGATVGLDVDTLELVDQGLALAIYDFGGRCFDFYAPPFLSPTNCVYVVVCDVSASGWQSELHQWLERLACSTQGGKVTVVASHTDLPPSAAPFDAAAQATHLRQRYPMLDITGVLAANCQSTRDAHLVRSHVYNDAQELIELEAELIPSTLFREVRELVHSMSLVDGPIISFITLANEAEKVLGLPADITSRAVKDLETRGLLLHLQPGSSDSLDVVITDIAWLVSAICHFMPPAAAADSDEQPGVYKMSTVLEAFNKHYPADPSGSMLLRILLKLEVLFPAPNTNNVLGVSLSRSQSQVSLMDHIQTAQAPAPASVPGGGGGSEVVLVPSLLRAAEQTLVAPWPPSGDDDDCSGYSFNFGHGMPASFMHRLQVRIFESADRRCAMDGSTVTLRSPPGPTGRSRQRAWFVKHGCDRLDLVVIGPHPGPVTELLVRMVQELATDKPRYGAALAPTITRSLLCPLSIRQGRFAPGRFDEDGVRLAATAPSLLLCCQRRAVASLPLPAQVAARVASLLASDEEAGRLILRAKTADRQQPVDPAQMLLLRPDGTLDAAATGMVLIQRQPVPATVLRSDPVLFRVTAAGAGPLRYQWYRGAKKLLWQTAPVLAIDEARRDEEGAYSCVVSNEVGAVRSDAAELITYISQPAPVAAPAVGTPTADGLHISWTEPPAFGETVTEYRLQLQGEAGLGPHAKRTLDGYTSRHAAVSGLELGTGYTARVAARNRAGWGEWGEWSQPVKTLDVPAPRILSLSFTRSSRGHEMDGAVDEAAAPDAPAAEPAAEPEPEPEPKTEPLLTSVVANPRKPLLSVVDERVRLTVDLLADDEGEEARRRGKPEGPTFTWFKDGKAIAAAGPPETHPAGVLQSSLALGRVSEKDGGAYHCVVANSAGRSHTQPVRLEVYKKTDVALGNCVICTETNLLWTLDCKCDRRAGLFGVCACCAGRYSDYEIDGRCPQCSEAISPRHPLKRDIMAAALHVSHEARVN